MRTSHLLPEECKEEIRAELERIRLEMPHPLTMSPDNWVRLTFLNGKAEFARWVLGDDGK